MFYLQARQARQLLTLKCEKEQVRALGEYLGGLLAKLPGGAGEEAGDTALLEPVDAAWTVAALGVGYDQDGDRVVLETRELLEEETEEEPAVARFHITRGQAAAFVERVRAAGAGWPAHLLDVQPAQGPQRPCLSSQQWPCRPAARLTS